MSAKVTECVRAACRLLNTSPVFASITCRYGLHVDILYIYMCANVRVYKSIHSDKIYLY